MHSPPGAYDHPAGTRFNFVYCFIASRGCIVMLETM